MSKKNQGPPFLVEVGLHALSGGLAGKSMDEAIAAVSEDVQAVVNSYYTHDIPLVAAVMKMSADAILEMTGESGKELCGKIMEGTTTYAVQYRAKDGPPKNPVGGGESS